MSDEQFNSLYNMFETNNQNIIQLGKEMERNIAKLDAKIDSNIAGLDAKIDKLEEKFDKKFDELNSRIDKLEKQSKKFKTDTNKRFEQLEFRITRIENIQNQMGIEIKEMHDEIKGITYEFKSQSRYLGELYYRVEKIDGIKIGEEKAKYFASKNSIKIKNDLI